MAGCPRARLVDIVLLSPLSVVPDRQRSGIGGLLLRTAVKAALRRSPVLALEGDPGYYGARGFDAAGDHGIVPPSDRIPPAACQVILGQDDEPWMTGRIVYPEVWWRHDAVGLRDPLLEQVEQQHG
ncbi:GNAT family N-acetyltransferase [Tersicoccus sp. Bi-70]|uniref:GNAT family N-acetyltransferase n=1 Tax=Tersicoccus sp. Bi-70 TaxID=1897634 RepID=UPI00097B4CC3|nr:hypothetical protein [Tersicoccus sp. Bi-70]OMH36849.1 hypothetical protein BGP79_13940 [Tersicoccus sp. Bi-70]